MAFCGPQGPDDRPTTRLPSGAGVGRVCLPEGRRLGRSKAQAGRPTTRRREVSKARVLTARAFPA